MVARWQAAGRTGAADLKVRCAAFAGTIIERWEGNGTARDPEAGALLMASLARLDDARLIGTFLARVVARDRSVDPDEALAGVCVMHGWATFRTELAAVFDATTAETIGRDVRLLERVCTPGSRQKGDWLDLCQVLAQKAVSALEAIDREDVAINSRVREVKRPEVLAGLALSLIATDQFEWLARVVAHALGAPRAYPLPAHVAALTSLGPWLKKHLKRPCEAVSRWLAACCDQLQSLTGHEPVAPADFRREANLSCKCADCDELRRFLKDPLERVHRFRVRQDRRQHLEHAVRGHRCDVDCVTERTGSPQTLVCTKNTASYDAKLKKYREDREHLAVLRSIQASVPE
jgi:hypothetical protein